MVAFEKYEAEARETWGKTDAYREFAEKTGNYSQNQWDTLEGGMDEILKAFAASIKSGAAPGASETQSLVKKLQDHITENYYTCTREILVGLGQMYVADARFQENIDKYAQGTARYISKAIAIYCEK